MLVVGACDLASWVRASGQSELVGCGCRDDEKKHMWPAKPRDLIYNVEKTVAFLMS